MCAPGAKATAHRIISDINVLEGESEIDRRGAFHRGAAEKKVFLPRINANERGSGEIAKNWPNLKSQIFETRRNGGSGGEASAGLPKSLKFGQTEDGMLAAGLKS
jgi:hypothetical protein